MRMRIDFLDNDINIDDENVFVMEIENKKYFYRVVNDLYLLSNREEIDDIEFYDEKDNEINNLKVQVIVDYFDFGLTSRKIIIEIQKNIVNSINEESMLELNKAYNNLNKKMIKALMDIDLPLEIKQDFDLYTVIKMFNISIRKNDNLLENLLLLIDINRILKIYDIMFFVNLKQYLNKGELEELYKYSIYNDIKIILIDSQSYGVTLKEEKKLIIDDNLDEFMI